MQGKKKRIAIDLSLPADKIEKCSAEVGMKLTVNHFLFHFPGK